ncbi:hypothetical protein ACIRU3_42730 [Streptomyces sp. NPDC101151]|uniref:hypothetical protein n=1 Tax=Streptomyces sp. NPDC101151 TaxID=3366115 RepID=UPI0037FE7282
MSIIAGGQQAMAAGSWKVCTGSRRTGAFGRWGGGCLHRLDELQGERRIRWSGEEQSDAGEQTSAVPLLDLPAQFLGSSHYGHGLEHLVVDRPPHCLPAGSCPAPRRR